MTADLEKLYNLNVNNLNVDMTFLSTSYIFLPLITLSTCILM